MTTTSFFLRGRQASRLDYIFGPDRDNNKLDSEVKWNVCNSDHGGVLCKKVINVTMARGPGIKKLDPIILENEYVKNEIQKKLSEMLDQILDVWNPHQKLEFMKVALRSATIEVTSKFRKERINLLKEIDKELKVTREKLEALHVNNDIQENINEIIATVEAMQQTRNAEEEKEIENLAFKAQVKWYEQGEKNTKYFLNLLNRKTNQSTYS